MANTIDGKNHPMENYQLTVELSDLQWTKAPEAIVYTSAKQRWVYCFKFDHMDFTDGGENIVGWWYHYKHMDSDKIHKILLIND